MDKKAFRDICKKKITSLNNTQIYAKDKNVLKKLEKVLNSKNIKNIMSFIPMKKEPKIDKFLNKRRGKYNIFVPFMVGVSFKLVEYRLPLRKSRFGIKEPNNSLFRLIHIDLAIVPVLGVDGNFQRVGFGKGMYDRFFEKMSVKPPIVFIQLDDCLTEKKICDKYDIQGDLYITPKKIYKKKVQKNDNRAKFSRSWSNSRSNDKLLNI